MLQFKRRELEFELDDKVHRMKYPTLAVMADFDDGREKAKNELYYIAEFYEKLGLNKQVALGMEMDHINTILEELKKQKKN